MTKNSTIEVFFKKPSSQNLATNTSTQFSSEEIQNTPNEESLLAKRPRIESDSDRVDLKSLPRDPGLRPQIWDYSMDQHDDIHRTYIMLRPYQPILPEYPLTGSG